MTARTRHWMKTIAIALGAASLQLASAAAGHGGGGHGGGGHGIGHGGGHGGGVHIGGGHAVGGGRIHVGTPSHVVVRGPHVVPPHITTGHGHHYPHHVRHYRPYRSYIWMPPVSYRTVTVDRCYSLKRKAMRTGSRRWWSRYEACLEGTW